jgi:hypothetical protein
MNRDEPSNSEPPPRQPGGRPPRTILEVLCREVGAAHPDGALKQIRSMKRLLRSHYHNQQRLQRWGLDGLGDAVREVKRLQTTVRDVRTTQRQRAAANVAALDDALEVLESARQQLRERATAPPAAVGTEAATDPPEQEGAAQKTPPPGAPVREEPDREAPGEKAPGQEAPGQAPVPEAPVQEEMDTALRIIRSVRAEVEEMRLELWAADDSTASGPVPGKAAQALLQRLAGWLDDVSGSPTPPSPPADDASSLLERLQKQQERLNLPEAPATQTA